MNTFLHAHINFSIILLLHNNTSVLAAKSVSWASDHKRLSIADVLSCHTSHHLCGWLLHYARPVIEIVHPWVRKGNLQHRVMMFYVDYPSYSHCKPNRHTRHLCPVVLHVPVHPPFTCSAGRPLRLHYNTSRKMNHHTVRLRFLPSCAYSSQETKHPFGLCLSTPSAPIYT
jgi:hypothetical protein